MSDRRKLPFGVGVGSRVDPSGCVSEVYTKPVSRLDPAGSVFSLEWRDHEREAAKERERARKGNQPGASKETLPYLDAGQSRDKAGERVGVSGKSIDLPSKDGILMRVERIE